MESKENSKLQFFESMYNKTYKLVYYIINRIVFDKQVSEDLVQDTYVSAYKNMDSLDPLNEETFKSWVGVIASNKAKDYLKKKRPNLFADMTTDDIEFEPEDTRISVRPDQEYHANDLKKIVREIMEELPEDQRLMIMMFYFQELSIKEIAATTQLNENTIKSKLNYAKAKIKNAFDKDNYRDYKALSLSPLALFVFGLKPISEVNIKPFGALAINQVGTMKSKKKNQNSVSKIGLASLIAGLSLTGYSMIAPDNISVKPTPDNELVQTDVVDLFDYINVEFSGLNGQGIANIKVTDSNNESVNRALRNVVLSFNGTNLSDNSLFLVHIDNGDKLDIEIKHDSKYYLVQGLK